MKRLLVVVLAVLCVMGLVVGAGAMDKKKCDGGMPSHEGCRCGGGEGAHPNMEMLKRLGLDAKQEAAVKAIHEKTQKEMIKRQADIKIAEIELREILAVDTVDMAAAAAAVKKLEGLKTDMKMMSIKSMEEVKSNLNPEQKKKIIEMVGRGPVMDHSKCDEHGKGKGEMGMHHGQH